MENLGTVYMRTAFIQLYWQNIMCKKWLATHARQIVWKNNKEKQNLSVLI